ncbi:putative FBD domain, leucine-rich repeat domain superfamily, F-box-like domain superfamily [Helianthus annuus]|nr:putative FBD domain, leucine-rich repeat domain superfamily, F-box-like domain superfamily [Helianthus annuus]
MNLHSKEVAIKRPKPPNLDETDFISKLHDSLLLQILSLLPQSDATRTRILSNRWKNLCSFLPNLHFVMPFCSNIEQVNKFHDSVDQTLALRGGIPIPHLKVQTGGGDFHVAQLVTCLSNVKVLTLNDSTLTAFINVHNLDMPVFPNLVEFAIGLDVFCSWSMLPTFFNKMPNVEHITFLKGFLPFPHAQHIYTMRWNPPVEVPTCLRFKMKKITIKNRETVTPEELKLISYMLKHANHLEILTINAHKIDPKTRGQVLKFYRGSKSCRIEFV